tara:strand:+ start:589 stop:972 length:384 start_codon:yes stop_codon:yes gene_type:complete
MNIFSSLPTPQQIDSKYRQAEILNLKGTNVSLPKVGRIITSVHFDKIVRDIGPSDFQTAQLERICMEFNDLTVEQQDDRDEAHLSADEDFAVFVNEHEHVIIQHEPTYTRYRVIGLETLYKMVEVTL